MKVRCQYCSKEYDVKNEYVGRKGKCDACGKIIELVPHFERTNETPKNVVQNPSARNQRTGQRQSTDSTGKASQSGFSGEHPLLANQLTGFTIACPFMPVVGAVFSLIGVVPTCFSVFFSFGGNLFVFLGTPLFALLTIVWAFVGMAKGVKREAVWAIVSAFGSLLLVLILFVLGLRPDPGLFDPAPWIVLGPSAIGIGLLIVYVRYPKIVPSSVSKQRRPLGLLIASIVILALWVISLSFLVKTIQNTSSPEQSTKQPATSLSNSHISEGIFNKIDKQEIKSNNRTYRYKSKSIFTAGVKIMLSGTAAGIVMSLIAWQFFRREGVPFWTVAPIWRWHEVLKTPGIVIHVISIVIMIVCLVIGFSRW